MPVEFMPVEGVNRSVYKQADGSFKLADECICWWGVKKLDYSIDEHAIAARQTSVEVNSAPEVSHTTNMKSTTFS